MYQRPLSFTIAEQKPDTSKARCQRLQINYPVNQLFAINVSLIIFHLLLTHQLLCHIYVSS